MELENHSISERIGCLEAYYFFFLIAWRLYSPFLKVKKTPTILILYVVKLGTECPMLNVPCCDWHTQESAH